MRHATAYAAIVFVTILTPEVGCAQVRPGDVIASRNLGEVANLLSPGNQFLVKQGMELDIVPTTRIE
jgi:hypothetical protein